MKHVVKHPELISKVFQKEIERKKLDKISLGNNYHKKQNGNELWKIVKNVKGFNDIKFQLLDEQGYTCCYCNCRLTQSNATIEHLLPKGIEEYKKHVADYDNLLVACSGKCEEQQYNGIIIFPQYCGCSKGRFLIPISPIQEDCEDHFSYNLDGTVSGLNDEAKKTISILNLNCHTLVNRRKTALSLLYDKNSVLLPDSELKTFYVGLANKTNGQYLPFFFVIRKAIELICPSVK